MSYSYVGNHNYRMKNLYKQKLCRVLSNFCECKHQDVWGPMRNGAAPGGAAHWSSAWTVGSGVEFKGLLVTRLCRGVLWGVLDVSVLPCLPL